MKRIVPGIGLLIGVFAFSVVAPAATVPIGYVAWDVTFPGNAGSFDITNLSGPNSDPLPAFDFPITTLLNLSNLNLVVDFLGGGSTSYGPSYFTLAPDGESFNGSAIPIGGTNPEPIDATLTGTISPLAMTYNTDSAGDPVSTPILLTFTAMIGPDPCVSEGLVGGGGACVSPLQDGDLGIIYATTTTLSGVPEPGTWLLFGTGLLSLMVTRRKFWKGLSAMTAMKGSLPALCAVAMLSVFSQSASAQVNLTGVTTPSSGAAGVTNVNLTGSGFPAGTIPAADVMVSFANTCGGTPVNTVAANSIRTVLGSTRRVNVNIPGGLTTGNYFLKVTDTTGGDPDFTTNAGSCAEVQVTGSTAILNACVAGSSMGVLLPSGGAAGTVTAYVPKGYWEGSATGVYVQNIEGTPSGTSTVATPSTTNSCSSNPATGQTICVANNTDVYLITGTTLNTTLNSGSNTTAGFSGGSCNNCGVAVNANNNTAVINMGLSGSKDGGLQILNLSTNTFGAPLPLTGGDVSENISVDPTRSLILSAGEDNHYTIAQIQANGSLLEFDSTFTQAGENDSSAEDCSTGVAITPDEFTNTVGLVNMNSITFTPGSPGTYTAPNTTATLVTSYSFSAGLSGSAVAQGSGHLAVVTGEFGGTTFAVLKLPATAGTGVPSLVDYAVAAIPSTTSCAGGGFSAGFDPHTITAYTSPNTGDSYAVFAGYAGVVPVCLAVVDMSTVINSTLSPRGGGGLSAHDIAAADLPAAAVTFFPL